MIVPLILSIRRSGVWFTSHDLMIATASYLCSNVGGLLSSQSIKYGKAGVVQGLENLRALWLTIIMAVIQ